MPHREIRAALDKATRDREHAQQNLERLERLLETLQNPHQPQPSRSHLRVVRDSLGATGAIALGATAWTARQAGSHPTASAGVLAIGGVAVASMLMLPNAQNQNGPSMALPPAPTTTTQPGGGGEPTGPTGETSTPTSPPAASPEALTETAEPQGEVAIAAAEVPTMPTAETQVPPPEPPAPTEPTPPPAEPPEEPPPEEPPEEPTEERQPRQPTEPHCDGLVRVDLSPLVEVCLLG